MYMCSNGSACIVIGGVCVLDKGSIGVYIVHNVVGGVLCNG